MVLLAGTIKEDLSTQRETWDKLCALASDPPISRLRVLDIEGWQLGEKSRLGQFPVEA